MNSLGFSFQILNGDINILTRAGYQHHEYGDPYDFVTTIEICDGLAIPQGAIIRGSEVISMADFRKFEHRLRKEFPQIVAVDWDRLKNGILVPKKRR